MAARADKADKKNNVKTLPTPEELDAVEQKVRENGTHDSQKSSSLTGPSTSDRAVTSEQIKSKDGDKNGNLDGLPSEEFQPIEDEDDDAADSVLSASEKAALIEQLQKSIVAKGGTTEDVSDATLLRFLRARNLNVEKAANMWCQFQKWRSTFVPLGYIPESDCTNELAQKKTSLQGWDKQGRPLIVLQVAKHVANRKAIEEVKRTTVYIMDKACANVKPGAEQFCVIVDLSGVGYKNLDFSATYHVFYQLQSYYPERLGKIWLLHAPYIFHAFWKMVTPFLYKRTRRKIMFVDGKRAKKTLLEHIDEEYLPTLYGGKAELVPVQDAVVAGWPPSNSDVKST